MACLITSGPMPSPPITAIRKAAIARNPRLRYASASSLFSQREGQVEESSQPSRRVKMLKQRSGIGDQGPGTRDQRSGAPKRNPVRGALLLCALVSALFLVVGCTTNSEFASDPLLGGRPVPRQSAPPPMTPARQTAAPPPMTAPSSSTSPAALATGSVQPLDPRPDLR